MEKITILCGMENREKAEKFMAVVSEGIQKSNFSVTNIDVIYLVLETKYTRTAFIYDDRQQPLHYVEADAIFGREPYKQQLAVYLKKLKPYDVDKGLVDYICECEKNGPELEAKATIEAANKIFEDTLRNHLDKQIYITTAQATGKTAFMKEWERYIHADCASIIKEHNVASIYPNSLIMNDWKWTVNPGGGISFGKIPEKPQTTLPEIKDVIFNNPATIVFWSDGTKTVVKADNEPYDPEKGLAMAIAKKVMGNKREYYHTFLHWLKKV